MSEIWLVNNTLVDSPASFLKKYYTEWLVAILLSAVYIGLLYGLYVPNWEFNVSSSNSTLSIPNYGLETETMLCGVRGSLQPPCNAVGLIDRLVLGENHLYKNPVYKRTKECSVNSLDYGPLPPNSPEWCVAPFDPEGLLSSVMAAVTCFVGLHFGHLIVHVKVDVKRLRKPFLILQWMGMNVLIVYILAASELFPAAIQGFYWQSPTNNLVNITEYFLQTIFHSEKWGALAFVLLEILFWCIVAGFLHRKGIFIKL